MHLQRKQDKKPENADDPYDSVEIQKQSDGTYRAMFYVAAKRRSEKFFPVGSLDTLLDQQKAWHSAGYICPLTDRAIRLLRQAMDLPELH